MALEVKNIHCSRGHRQLFTGLNFSLNSGEVLLVEGKNGSGKSTLLKIVSGLRRPDSGDVLWNKQSLSSIFSEYTQQLVWLSHRNGINDSLTAKENIQVSISLSKSTDVNIKKVLEKIGLNAYANTPVRQFSAGMKRRLALSRLLTQKAQLWVLDEPQGALDKAGIKLLESLVEEHVANDGMVIMSSHHDVQFENITINTLQLYTHDK
ncbi:MAG: cytochrome c biogenesis heme-transporting ATPase CcmA [Methylophaga sp.]|nr:cytochrome c biogenesis heme-transporting ATPase CcmA [Methylophaga sp.]